LFRLFFGEILRNFRFSKFRKIEEILNSLGRKESWAKRFTLSEILNAWCEIVGPDISKIARPSLLRGKKIFVEVEESIWLAQLQSEAEELREKLNETLGSKKIKEIRFVLSSEPLGSLKNSKNKSEIKEKYQPESISERDEEKANKLIDEVDDMEFREMAKKLLVKIKKAEDR
tara:strand:- start:384 stop:902 length:519 start_codon:yes stop_codon:yes gene_type:complete